MKGQPVIHYDQMAKMRQLQTIFQKYIKQIMFGRKETVFGLPIMSHTRSHIIQQTKDLPYGIYIAYNIDF